MVDEARVVAFARGINDLVGVERHEVEVLQVLALVLVRPLQELIVLQYLSHVLHHECATAREQM